MEAPMRIEALAREDGGVKALECAFAAFRFTSNEQAQGNVMSLLHQVQRLIREEEGVTAIEYALIASLIALIAISGMGLLGNQLNLMFQHVKNQLQIS